VNRLSLGKFTLTVNFAYGGKKGEIGRGGTCCRLLDAGMCSRGQADSTRTSPDRRDWPKSELTCHACATAICTTDMYLGN
jgi:hypothetical protein